MKRQLLLEALERLNEDDVREFMRWWGKHGDERILRFIILPPAGLGLHLEYQHADNRQGRMAVEAYVEWQSTPEQVAQIRGEHVVTLGNNGLYFIRAHNSWPAAKIELRKLFRRWSTVENSGKRRGRTKDTKRQKAKEFIGKHCMNVRDRNHIQDELRKNGHGLFTADDISQMKREIKASTG